MMSLPGNYGYVYLVRVVIDDDQLGDVFVGEPILVESAAQAIEYAKHKYAKDAVVQVCWTNNSIPISSAHTAAEALRTKRVPIDLITADGLRVRISAIRPIPFIEGELEITKLLNQKDRATYIYRLTEESIVDESVYTVETANGAFERWKRITPSQATLQLGDVVRLPDATVCRVVEVAHDSFKVSCGLFGSGYHHRCLYTDYSYVDRQIYVQP